MKRRMDVAKTFEKMAESGVFLALATRNYVRDYRRQGDVYEQIKMARALKKPVIIMQAEQLSRSEKQELQDSFKGMEVIAVISFNERGNKKQFEQKVGNELMAAFEYWKKSRGINSQ